MKRLIKCSNAWYSSTDDVKDFVVCTKSACEVIETLCENTGNDCYSVIDSLLDIAYNTPGTKIYEVLHNCYD